MRSALLQWLATVAAFSCLASADPLLPYFSAVSYNYILNLDLHNLTKKEFIGEAKLRLTTTNTVEQDKKDFVINSADLTPLEVSISYPNGRHYEVVPTDIKIDKEHQTISIPGREFFYNNSIYEIRIIYKAKYDETSGIIRTVYNSKNYITSRLYPSFSRKVFPSLDQPGNVIPISLTLNVAYLQDKPTIIAGLNLTGSSEETQMVSSYYISQFPIPNWSIFFTIGEYEEVKNVQNFYATKDIASKPTQVDTAVKASSLANIREMNAAVGITTPITVVVPGLPTPSESGLGITALSMAIGVEKGESTNSGLKEQAVQILKALVKSLFGSAISPKNWNDIWISESVSLYLAETLLSQLSRWTDFKDMSPDSLISALDGSWSDDSSPVQPNITDNAMLLNYLKDPAIAKGAVILGMIESLVKPVDRQSAFTQYLQDRKGSSVTTDDFLEKYAQYTNLNATKNFPEGKTLQELIKPWLTQTGYPAVVLQRQGTDVLASEHRYSIQDSTLKDHIWVIPIQYRRASNSSASNDGDELIWLVPSTNSPLKLESEVDESTAIILNAQQPAGLYRTLYDELDMKVLKDILATEISNISPGSRANIIRDSFAFAKSQQLKYSSLLDMLKYLANERSLEPWKASLSGFQFLWDFVYFLEQDHMRTQFENYVGDLIRPAYVELGLGLEDPGFVKGMLRRMLVETHCDLDDWDCRRDTEEAYEKYIVGNKTIAASDMYPVIYCNGIRSLTDATVLKGYLLALYNDKNLSEDNKRNGFSYLACPSDNATISYYLSYLLVEKVVPAMTADDIVMAFQEVASRPEHLDISFAFYTRSYNRLNNILTSEHKASMINFLGQKGSTDYHIEILKNFVFGNDTVIQNAVTESLANLEERKKFINDNYDEIQIGIFNHIVSPTPPTSPTPTNPSPTSPPDPTNGTDPTPKPAGASAISPATTLVLTIAFAALALVFH